MKHRQIVLAFALATLIVLPVGLAAAGEGEPAPRGEKAKEIVVTATKTPRDPARVPGLVTTVGQGDVQTRQLSRTLPEALREVPGVLVQQTSRGQGSPFIRGFTGFRTLLLIDGIRLNNAVFRDGPNQYWNTVDPQTIGRLEVFRGPASVLFGSDAVGGTVNVLTRSGRGGDGAFDCERRLYYRYASAESAHVGRVEVSGGEQEDFTFLAGGSYRNFGDLEGGRHVGEMPDTGYEEADGDARVDLVLDDHWRLVFAHQNVNIFDAWRAHKTTSGVSWRGTDIGSEMKRSLDQHRDLTYLQLYGEDLPGPLTGLAASLSWQTQAEERYRRRASGIDRQGFVDNTYGAWLQLQSPCPLGGQLTGGLEYYRDCVDSWNKRYDGDGRFLSESIQGPVGDRAAYDLVGLYLQSELPLAGERLELILGGRYTYAHAYAWGVEDPVNGVRMEVEDEWHNLVGSARLLAQLDEGGNWHAFTGVGQAFRAPNLSDLTRLDTARSNEIETPVTGLDPERFISGEFGLRASYARWTAEAAYYYTAIDDLIVRTPTGRVIDGDSEVTKVNSGQGFVQGIEAAGRVRLTGELSAFGGVAWQDGEVDGYPTSAPVKVTDTLSRLLPTSGHAGLRWEREEPGVWLEGVVRMADSQDDLSAGDRRDTQRIPPGGTPGYVVYTARGGWRASDNLTLSLALENITDLDYRIHGSGQNEPGFNAVAGLELRF